MTKQMKPRGPFECVRENMCEDGHRYEAVFALADDGTPNGRQYLVVDVITHGEVDTEIILKVRTSTGEHLLGACHADLLPVVERLLCGAAAIVTTKTLEPLRDDVPLTK